MTIATPRDELSFGDERDVPLQELRASGVSAPVVSARPQRPASASVVPVSSLIPHLTPLELQRLKSRHVAEHAPPLEPSDTAIKPPSTTLDDRLQRRLRSARSVRLAPAVGFDDLLAFRVQQAPVSTATNEEGGSPGDAETDEFQRDTALVPRQDTGPQDQSKDIPGLDATELTLEADEEHEQGWHGLGLFAKVRLLHDKVVDVSSRAAVCAVVKDKSDSQDLFGKVPATMKTTPETRVDRDCAPVLGLTKPLSSKAESEVSVVSTKLTLRRAACIDQQCLHTTPLQDYHVRRFL